MERIHSSTKRCGFIYDSEYGSKESLPVNITARGLATYLILRCVGRGVRLGSENSSGAGGAGGALKSGDLEIWEFGDLETWKSRNLQIWGPGNPENCVPKIQKQISKFKSVLPKMLARSGLVGNKSSWPYLGPSEAIFSIGPKNPKNV